MSSVTKLQNHREAELLGETPKLIKVRLISTVELPARHSAVKYMIGA